MSNFLKSHLSQPFINSSAVPPPAVRPDLGNLYEGMTSAFDNGLASMSHLGKSRGGARFDSLGYPAKPQQPKPNRDFQVISDFMTEQESLIPLINP